MTTHSTNSDLYFSTVRELRAKFDAREISSVEATRTILDRIAALEPKLNTFITVTADRAIADAEIADQRLQGTGQEPTALTGVPVMVKDEPGELARLFVAAGDLSVNLEDVRIEHVLGRPSGLVDLFVQPAVRDALVEGLERAGFDVRT